MPGIFDRVQAEVDARAPRDARQGLSALELLSLKPDEVTIVQRLLRRGASDAAALAEELSLPVADVESRLADLVAKGLVQRSDDAVPRYWLHAVRRRVRVPEGMWARLADETARSAAGAGRSTAAGEDDVLADTDVHAEVDAEVDADEGGPR